MFNFLRRNNNQYPEPVAYIEVDRDRWDHEVKEASERRLATPLKRYKFQYNGAVIMCHDVFANGNGITFTAYTVDGPDKVVAIFNRGELITLEEDEESA